MPNAFAALDDSDSENEVTKVPPKKEFKKKPQAAEPSKVEPRKQHTNDKNKGTGRHQRPPVREGKRTHDRRSGTGRGKEIKKDGGGARNWGSDKNEARDLEGAIKEDEVGNLTTEKPAEEGAEPEEAAAEEGKEKEKVEEKEPEPEVVTYSYEEYLVMKNEARSDSAAFKPFQEKQIDNAFAGMSVKAKVNPEDDIFVKFGTDKAPKKKTKRKEKEVLTGGFRTDSSQKKDTRDGDRRDGGRERRGGRGRSEGRSGRGRGGGGGGARQSQGLDVADAASFPSLG